MVLRGRSVPYDDAHTPRVGESYEARRIFAGDAQAKAFKQQGWRLGHPTRGSWLEGGWPQRSLVMTRKVKMDLKADDVRTNTKVSGGKTASEVAAKHETEWKKHLGQIVGECVDDLVDKYTLGQKEHGGRLWRKPCLPRLKDEALDMIVYVYTLDEQHCAAMELLEQARTLYDEPGHGMDEVMDLVSRAFNILLKGNPDGDDEEDQ